MYDKDRLGKPSRFGRNEIQLSRSEFASLPADPIDVQIYTDRPDGHARNFSDYVHIVLKHKFYAIVAFLIVITITALYTFLATPVYRSYATLEVDEEAKKTLNLGLHGEVLKGMDKEYYATQLEILKSRALAEKLAKTMNLKDYPEFQTSNSNEITRVAGNFWAGVLEALGLRSEIDPEIEALKNKEMLVDEILDRISVQTVGKSRIISISMDAQDRNLSTAMLKNYIALYLEHNMGKRRSESLDAAMWLKKELAQVEKDLTKSRERLIDFTSKHGMVSLDKDLNHIVSSFTAAADNLLKSKEGRVRLQAFQKQEGKKNLHALPQLFNTEHIMKMKEHLAALESEYSQITAIYSPDYPKAVVLKKKVDEMRKRIWDAEESIVTAALGVAQKEEELVQDTFEKAKKKAMEMNSLGVEYAILQKEYDTNQAVYQMFLQKAKEMEVSAGVTGNNVAVILPPTSPHKPAKPKKGLNLIIGSLIGMIVGILVTFFKEATDNTIKSVDDLRMYLRIPNLGVVPNIDGIKRHHPGLNKKSRYELLAHQQPRSPLYDALKNIQTSIILSTVDAGPQAIAISSACPQEGKTLVAVAMATTMCNDNVKVLLIDCDLRRPRIHEIFDINQDEPGLSQLLLEKRPNLEEYIKPTFLTNLDLIVCGPLPLNPVTLLQSRRILEILNQCKRRYDFILLDCPPIMGFSDTRILAACSDGLILVVKEGQYSRKLVRNAIDSLSHSKNQIMGAVLNMTRPESSDYMTYNYNRQLKYYS